MTLVMLFLVRNNYCYSTDCASTVRVYLQCRYKFIPTVILQIVRRPYVFIYNVDISLYLLLFYRLCEDLTCLFTM